MKDKLIYQHIQNKEWHTITQNRILAQGFTGKQRYQIVELAHYGKALIINGCIQSTQKDEAYYHEALLYPGIVLHGNVKNILSFGGANGGIINRLIHLPKLKHLLVIDIDEILFHISRYYLPHMHVEIPPSLTVNQYFVDPIQWIEKNGKLYSGWADLIIADLPDSSAESYASKLFTTSFYQNMKQLLAKGGVFVTQAGQAHPFNMEFHQRAVSTLRQHFNFVSTYCHYVPSYGVPWAFIVASDKVDQASIKTTTLKRRIASLSNKAVSIYSLNSHQHMFCLSQPIIDQLTQQLEPISNENLELVQVAPIIENIC